MLGLKPMELCHCAGIGKSKAYSLLSEHENQYGIQNGNKKVFPPELVRTTLEGLGYTYPKLNISFQIVKGGAGKTTLATNFSYRCSQYGARVLLIDLDQQANATRFFGVDARERPVFLNIFRDNVPVTNAISKINNFLSILPSNLNNSRLDVEMTQKTSFNMRDLIKNVLSSIRNDFDIIVMDCPPAINKINASVTCASDLIVLPINPEEYSLDGMQFSISEFETIEREFNLQNLNYKLLWNKYDAREKYAPKYLHALAREEKLFDKVLPVVIGVHTDFKNSVKEQRSIFENPKKTNAKNDVDDLTLELLGIREWLSEKNKTKGALNEAS